MQVHTLPEDLTISSYLKKSAKDIAYASKIIESSVKAVSQDPFNAVLRVENKYIQNKLDVAITWSLRWVPIAIKDNFLLEWTINSNGSKMLENYIAPYTATCVSQLENAGALFVATTNMDDSAMWSSGESSYFWPTQNPIDTTRVPGGSSSGSAAAVAWWLVMWALGTDTWWSVRLPAALCGIVWVKPTYGRVSRYGICAMASSLDQAWVFTKNVDDAALLLHHMSGADPQDATSVDTSTFEATKKSDSRLDLSSYELSGKRFALPKQYIWEALDDRIHKRLREVISFLESKWAIIEEIDMPILEYGVSTYYIVCPAEVCTNLARYDGVRFGLQKKASEYGTLEDYYADIRSEWFGEEVQRRILTWSHVLSAGHYDAYYQKAQNVRKQLRKELACIYKDYDAIIWPTSPVPAWKLWSNNEDPTQMYLMDIYTVIANLAWNPAISVPMGTVEEEGVDLPVWLQIMTDMWDEYNAFGVAKSVEEGLRLDKKS